MPDRFLLDALPGAVPEHEHVQQLIEAESGHGTQGVRRTWQASDSDRVVLTSDSGGVKISRDNGATAPTNVINVGTPAGGSLAGAYPNPTLSTASINALVPPGSIWPYAGATAPAGWFLCNGQAVNRSANPVLFALITTTYNTGGEAGTDFRLPNLQGRVILGVSGTHPLSTAGGAESVNAPTHTHVGTHNHGLNSHLHDLTNTHTHHMSSHTHTSDPHTHGMTNHDHTMNGHAHQTNIDHGHGASTGGATGTVERVVVGTVSDPVHARDTHGHGVTVNVLGASYHDSLGPSTPNTSGATNYSDGSGNSGSTTPDPTGGPSTPLTDFPTSGSVTGGPSVTGNVNTALGGSSPAATFDAPTLATLPPFLTLSYIIRAG